MINMIDVYGKFVKNGKTLEVFGFGRTFDEAIQNIFDTVRKQYGNDWKLVNIDYVPLTLESARIVNNIKYKMYYIHRNMGGKCPYCGNEMIKDGNRWRCKCVMWRLVGDELE